MVMVSRREEMNMIESCRQYFGHINPYQADPAGCSRAFLFKFFIHPLLLLESSASWRSPNLVNLDPESTTVVNELTRSPQASEVVAIHPSPYISDHSSAKLINQCSHHPRSDSAYEGESIPSDQVDLQTGSFRAFAWTRSYLRMWRL